jgi:hypothetical protein
MPLACEERSRRLYAVAASLQILVRSGKGLVRRARDRGKVEGRRKQAERRKRAPNDARYQSRRRVLRRGLHDHCRRDQRCRNSRGEERPTWSLVRVLTDLHAANMTIHASTNS